VPIILTPPPTDSPIRFIYRTTPLPQEQGSDNDDAHVSASDYRPLWERLWLLNQEGSSNTEEQTGPEEYWIQPGVNQEDWINAQMGTSEGSVGTNIPKWLQRFHKKHRLKENNVVHKTKGNRHHHNMEKGEPVVLSQNVYGSTGDNQNVERKQSSNQTEIDKWGGQGNNSSLRGEDSVYHESAEELGDYSRHSSTESREVHNSRGNAYENEYRSDQHEETSYRRKPQNYGMYLHMWY